MQGTTNHPLGDIPVMVKSKACNLHGLSPAQLIRRKEEEEEMGGYYIVNGIERVMRMLIMPRRNMPMTIMRPQWKTRGKGFTEFGVVMRCVRSDQTTTNLILHYLSNGNAVLSFIYRKEQFFVPILLLLKALVNTTDQNIFNQILMGQEKNTFLIGCVNSMLRQAQDQSLTTRSAILKYIGERFRIKLNVPEWFTDTEVTKFLLHHCICVHAATDQDKFNSLIFMARKLYAFAKGECCQESTDSPMNQEVLLAGHLYLMVLKEKLENWLIGVRMNLEKAAKSKGETFKVDQKTMSDAMCHVSDLSRPMEYLISTGNLASKTGLGLMQAAGLTVVADKLNFMRYISHFRCIHRGAFFSEMRTTSVRKLLPEAWGFLCPVHTPDGTPCGLMNHLSANCVVVNQQPMTAHLSRLLCSLGMIPYDSVGAETSQCLLVLLDGRVLGIISEDAAKELANKLRMMKVNGLQNVPSTMEIVLVVRTTKASQYPGLFLFTTPARMMRPVFNLAGAKTELIGTFEQVYMDIAVTPSEAHPGVTTHMEESATSILSAVASLTPFSDFNQSPRNMYQCQMGKQTMGFPSYLIPYRSDHKMYKLQTPQSPLVRPSCYLDYNMDKFPLGTNAVVAVISYTGYDMEDAMILNKGSFERGFAHATVYKTEEIDLKKKSQNSGNRVSLIFGTDENDRRVSGKLDRDGLPAVGTVIQSGDPMYCYLNLETATYHVERYKGLETVMVDKVKKAGNDLGNMECQRVFITLRIERNPIIGDKFSSRHGQKGVCSQKWPQENMPFTESGMTPDIIFNPHGFPSRMTIGMMIESMAGKSGCLHGMCHDATPFTFSEDTPAIDYFGRMLTAAGYNYYGTERMYSGASGVELEADIFIGIVYYQRLRHMVADKFQVRSTGPIDTVTHQPIKGRKRGGGIRFGEMERDSLLAHGTSYLLQDRLLGCSDKTIARVCSKCGSILGVSLEKMKGEADVISNRKWVCSSCQSNKDIDIIAVPYVFQYLVAELGAMNIKTTFTVT
ncbi:DNA-directed RNA polymerase I subunit RPA2-like [Anneissia japonica]|uniref:DNA-directed RNA polymerase I subunit RPA2-like n=1 Tax=Anneissia japonica TaxID=1529436 RepID=UPI001425ACCB|nr:DNA-directed RNA polymerase I subunit RPA2-like [Anneissia japonica]